MKAKIIKNSDCNSRVNSDVRRKHILSLVFKIGVIVLCFFLLGMTSPQKKASDVDEAYMDISVREMAGLDIPRSLTGGVPIAEGAALKGSRFVLFDKNDKTVPCQSEVLATWKDGSARWVLLDFQASPNANATDHFRLKWDPRAKEVQPYIPVKSSQGKTVSIGSGSVQLKTIPGALLRISNRFDVKLVLTDRSGNRCEGVVESSRLETSGKMRSTMALSGSFRTSEGQRVVDFRLRASVYAGLQQFYLEPQILVNADAGMITYVNDLSFEIVSLNSIQAASIGGSPGWKGPPSPGAPVRLFQVDDENYRLEGTSGTGSKAPGWMEIDDGKGKLALTLRDFWQQWPKSLEVDTKVAKLGLFPRFKEGAFSHMEPWYKHDYLFEGNSYRLRQGQARRWQLWADLSGNGETLTKSVNQHLIPVPDPTQAIATGEWGFIAPAGSKGMAEYDTWADNLFEGYRRAIHEQRDYGAMNWGDWWGERGVNWGNHEYDTPLHIFKQFARTGDPKYFYVAEQSARHISEVDVVHFLNEELKKYFSRWESKAYPSRPGMVHEHSIGHVGGFHPVEKIKALYVEKDIGRGNPNPYLCLDPYNLGHIFTLGMAHYYLLTGDPWVKETVNRIGDNLMKLTEDGLYKFKGGSHSGRVNGWTMLALAGEYKINPTERCLKAMKHLADDALSEQNANSGGWMYKLPWGHCYCTSIEDSRKGVPSHVGEAGFIGSIRLNGLSYYYRLTGDERIPKALLRGVNHLNNDTWKENISDWRYTSCPASNSVNQTGVSIMALVNSININNDPEQLRILRKAWDAKFKRYLETPSTRPGLGKTYGLTMYGSPEAMNLFVNGGAKEGVAAHLFAQQVSTDGLSWKQVVNNQPASWYGSEDAVRIAENVLLYQRNSGGWPKNIPMHKPLLEKEKEQLLADKEKIFESTTDNDATTTEMTYLSKVFSQTRDPKYKEAFERGLEYLLSAQYPNGGWPQFYPSRKGYYSHITYNDNSMVNIMRVLKDIAGKTHRFAIKVDDTIAERARQAYEKGIDCILKTQYRQNGKLTAWCAQYDEVTLLPAKARSYELPSLSGSESAGIVKLLMEIDTPSSEVINAVQSAIQWFDKVKLTGIKVESFVNVEGNKDKRIVADKNAPPIWARFYQLDDNRPFFCDRDGIKKYSMAEIGHERRNGYAWYSYAPEEVIRGVQSWPDLPLK